ncbi:hypothetical protein BN137_3917 [Cronobacter condimenti 1330]|uniref:Uncharacterized protein n=1 Tax=Cronobacter condimenti 1330 TaxID=1073999 RepID=K8AFG0_9ENTR|nr:hypothetical protein BN137_3917 [Cronobacter condimenti 1330]
MSKQKESCRDESRGFFYYEQLIIDGAGKPAANAKKLPPPADTSGIVNFS